MMQESRPRSPSSSTALIPDSECDDRAKKRKVRGSLIAQFGGHDPFYMGHAAALIKEYVDGIDINCGCPQQWAYKEGIGSALLRKWIA